MGKKMTRAGMVLRRNIRADVDAEPAIDHLKIRSKYKVVEPIVESAMVKSVAEWDSLIATTPDSQPVIKDYKVKTTLKPVVTDSSASIEAVSSAISMPGLEQGVVKFARKPAKMGTDFILWIPRVYIKNGLVDPHAEYEVYLRKK
jgi:hypothetical protein